jgi:hypothetical protein
MTQKVTSCRKQTVGGKEYWCLHLQCRHEKLVPANKPAPLTARCPKCDRK